jgi:hypothetical protein
MIKFNTPAKPLQHFFPEFLSAEPADLSHMELGPGLDEEPNGISLIVWICCTQTVTRVRTQPHVLQGWACGFGTFIALMLRGTESSVCAGHPWSIGKRTCPLFLCKSRKS